MQGAGGVGGLIASVKAGNEYLYSFDANGNVGQMVKSTDGSIAAKYEYDPFGKTIFAEGVMVSENPYRFSTKYQDGDTGFYYYGFRFYNVDLGRWINRDPIGEVGSINRFAFVNNKSLNSCDVLGLYLASGHTEITSEAIQDEKWSKEINMIINKVKVILIKNNLQVDEEFLKFNYWHFNRDKGKESSADAKKKFSDNLGRIKYDFYSLIDKSEDVDCQDALRKLGNMTHAWQDYYAHAMRENTKGEGFEIKISGFVTASTMDLVPIGYIHGDPEHIPSSIIPSSFGSIPKYGIGGSYDLGEHGPTEPGGGLRAPDSDRRKRLATQFTKEQLATYIVDWFLKCGCTATVESWRKPNGNKQK